MLPIEKRAVASLLRDKKELSEAVTTKLYAVKPSLLEKHGEQGRTKCLQDMHYNIDHLAPAVELDDAAIFSRYVTWLDDMLRARNVGTDDVVQCLSLLRAACIDRYAEEGAFISRIIDEGLRSLNRVNA